MPLLKLSPWSVFEVESTSTDYSDVFTLSEDGNILTVKDVASPKRRTMLMYYMRTQPGDVVEFAVEAEHVSGTMHVGIQLGTASGPVELVDGNDAHSAVTLNDTVERGFIPYRVKIAVPQNHPGPGITTVVYVGAYLNEVGEARFRHPRIFLNGTQCNSIPDCHSFLTYHGKATNNYHTLILDDKVEFSQPMQFDGQAGFIGSPFLFDIGGFRQAFKMLGSDQKSTTFANVYYGATDGTETGGFRIARTAGAGPGQFAETPEGTIGFIDAFYDKGDAWKRAARMNFIKKTSGTGFKFTVLVTDSTNLNDASEGVGLRETGDFTPYTDNTRTCGSPKHRWSIIYAGTSAINTSDVREKVSISSVDEALMKAWGKVNFKSFQFIDAVEKKGSEEARVHFGVIAQQVQEAFASEGLDVSKYALFCYDKWNDEYEDIKVIDAEATYDENGNELTPQISHIEKKLVTPAGDRYGIRYSEALALEAAYQRWLGEQRDKEIAELKAMLANSKPTGYILS